MYHGDNGWIEFHLTHRKTSLTRTHTPSVKSSLYFLHDKSQKKASKMYSLVQYIYILHKKKEVAISFFLYLVVSNKPTHSVILNSDCLIFFFCITYILGGKKKKKKTS